MKNLSFRTAVVKMEKLRERDGILTADKVGGGLGG